MRAPDPDGAAAQMRRMIARHARLLPFIVRRRGLEEVLEYARVAPDPQFAGIAPEDIAAWVVEATRKPLLMRRRRCLRQGLLGMRFMRLAGHDPQLLFGVDAKSISAPNLSAHCWVAIDREPVLNDRQGTVEIYAWRPA